MTMVPVMTWPVRPALLLLAGLAGCDSNGYTPPASARIPTQAIVDRPMQEVLAALNATAASWGRQVGEGHYRPGFDAARTTVSLELEPVGADVTAFIDCGQFASEQGFAGPWAVYATRQIGARLAISLDARAEPETGRRIRVELRVRYVFRVPRTGTLGDGFGHRMYEAMTFSFDSTQAASLRATNPAGGTIHTRTCRATGSLETSFLAAARGG